MSPEDRRQRRRDAENARRAKKGLPPLGQWGGHREGGGRKPRERKESPKVAAQPRQAPAQGGMDPRALAVALPELIELSERYSKNPARKVENTPFRFPTFPKAATPASGTMAMDSDLVASMQYGTDCWLSGGDFGGLSAEGLMFLGYPYLSELAQRPEYRIISETIADDATRRWIDFDASATRKRNAGRKRATPSARPRGRPIRTRGRKGSRRPARKIASKS